MLRQIIEINTKKRIYQQFYWVLNKRTSLEIWKRIIICYKTEMINEKRKTRIDRYRTNDNIWQDDSLNDTSIYISDPNIK